MSLKCCACSTIKALDDFSSSQKRKKDSPRCTDCVSANRPVIVSLTDGPSGSHRRCRSCMCRKDPATFRGSECNDCMRTRLHNEAERANEEARRPSSGACKVKDVQRRYGHLCEIPIQAYREAGVASNWDDYVTERDVQAASDSWDARGIAHDIDTQWGALPNGGAYSDSNYYYGPGEYDYY